MNGALGLRLQAVVALENHAIPSHVEIVLLLLLIWHYLLGLLLLQGRRVDLLGTGEVLDCSHQERGLHVSSPVVVLRLTGQHVLSELVVLLLLLLLISSLLCLVVSMHVVIFDLILHKVVFAPGLPHVAIAHLLVTIGLDEVLEHLREIVLLRPID